MKSARAMMPTPIRLRAPGGKIQHRHRAEQQPQQQDQHRDVADPIDEAQKDPNRGTHRIPSISDDDEPENHRDAQQHDRGVGQPANPSG